MQVHYTDQVYRDQDGIRDPFQWSRFASAKFVGGATLVVLVVIFIGGSDGGSTVVSQGIDAGSHVAATAVRMTLGLE